MDCDGDGILDHTCHNTINYNRWLVLSSEGCPDSWGQLDRPVSACPQAFGGTIKLIFKAGLQNSICTTVYFTIQELKVFKKNFDDISGDMYVYCISAKIERKFKT